MNITPYKTGRLHGFPVTLQLLHPGVKHLIDLLYKNKGSYITISPEVSFLLIDNIPQVKISENYLTSIKQCLDDDVRVYDELTEYRLTETRWKSIQAYYQ